ncbi:MAG: hypothetical protein Kow00121_45310 [Elainellaceae cyanobacterium]
MRNDFATSQTRGPSSLQSPVASPQIPTPIPVPTSPGFSQEDGRTFRLETEVDQQRNLARDLSDQLRWQQERTEDLKSQLEKQQERTEDLRGQLEKQQRNTELLISQLQEQQRHLDRLSDQPMRVTPFSPDTSVSTEPTSSELQTIITGAVGIVVLVVVAGGGLVLFAIIVIVLLSSRRRPSRTVHIVHPFPPSYTALPPQRLLPPRARPRSARPIDVEYYNDSDYD